MNTNELIELIRKYPEWEADLDETACATGFVTCPICDGGGWLGDRRKRYSPPKHQPDCPRERFEQEYPANGS